MNDSLKIAVVLNEQLSPNVGGGFSYFNELVNKIDSYDFL